MSESEKMEFDLQGLSLDNADSIVLFPIQRGQGRRLADLRQL